MIYRSLSLCFLLAFVGCDPNSTTQPSAQSKNITGTIDVVATVGMVGDVVRNIGGQHVEVNQLCGSGVDPHLHKATPDNIRAIMACDIVFYCGLMLEGKMTDALIREARNRPVVAVTERIDESELLEPEDFGGHYDPHVWNNVSAWSMCVDVIVAELTALKPDAAADFQANARSYQDELAKLHEYGVKSLATIPQHRRVLITSHDAFNYFGRAYGLEVMGVQGLSTESEAGLQRINQLVDLLVDRKIQAVFVESSVSPKNIQSLVEGAASKGHDVLVGGELFSDAMGTSGAYEGSYIGMLDHNITLVTRGLGGEAPALGMNGKLSLDEK